MVQAGAEAGEVFQLLELRQRHPQVARDAAQRASLRLAAHARHRQAQVHRRELVAPHQPRRQVDLPVGDRDQVGRDVGRQVLGLGLDHRQHGDRAAAAFAAELPGALQQAGVHVEDVARKGLAPGRAAHQQRQLAVGAGVVRHVVDHQQHVALLGGEMLGHGHGRVGRDVGQAGRFLVAAVHHDAARQQAALPEGMDDARHRVAALADGAVDADQLRAALVEHGIDGQRGLAGLPVADDELALAQPDGDGGVDGGDAGGQRPRHGRPLQDRRGLGLDRHVDQAGHRAEAVARAPQRIDHAPQQGRAHGHADHLARAVHGLAHAHRFGRPEQDHAEAARLQVVHVALHAAGEQQQFVGQRAGQARDHRHAVADLGDHARFGQHRLRLRRGGQRLPPALEDRIVLAARGLPGHQASGHGGRAARPPGCGPGRRRTRPGSCRWSSPAARRRPR